MRNFGGLRVLRPPWPFQEIGNDRSFFFCQTRTTNAVARSVSIARPKAAAAAGRRSADRLPSDGVRFLCRESLRARDDARAPYREGKWLFSGVWGDPLRKFRRYSFLLTNSEAFVTSHPGNRHVCCCGGLSELDQQDGACARGSRRPTEWNTCVLRIKVNPRAIWSCRQDNVHIGGGQCCG